VWLVNYANYVAPAIGIDTWADIVAEAADGRCSIKFAAWPNTAELEAALHARGQHTIPPITPFIWLARHAERIICNGPSSVVRECRMLGRTAYLYLNERLLLDAIKADLWKLGQESNCRIVRSIAEIDQAQPNADTGGAQRPLDATERALAALLRHVPRALMH
jgi:hypothetical protein